MGREIRRSHSRRRSVSPRYKRSSSVKHKRRRTRSRERSWMSARRCSPSSRNRSKSPPSKFRRSTNSVGKEPSPRGRRGPSVGRRDRVDESERRSRSINHNRNDDPPFRRPDRDAMYHRDSLRKIVVNMRGVPEGNDMIRRNIINAEHIVVVRRAGEGSRPIFDRDEIKSHRKKYEDRDSRSPTEFSSRRYDLNGLTKSIRLRGSSEETCNAGGGSLKMRSSPSDYESRDYDKGRKKRSGDELRHPPPSRSRSRDRIRDPVPEKRGLKMEDRRDFRRTPERDRDRIADGPTRRPVSSDDWKGPVVDPCRDRDYPPNDVFRADPAIRPRGYYELQDVRDRPRPSTPVRLGPPVGPFMRNAPPHLHHLRYQVHPPLRPVVNMNLTPKHPRLRLPFPPRLGPPPMVRQLVRVFPPGIPARTAVVPVRPAAPFTPF